MNYVPKHSREHASSEYCHMWGRKGTELIRNKQTNSQTNTQTVNFINSTDQRSDGDQDGRLLLLASDEKCKGRSPTNAEAERRVDSS